MLKGKITYRENGAAETNPVTITVYGKDTGAIQLYMTTENTTVADYTHIMNIWDSSIDKEGKLVDPTVTGDDWRRLSIQKASRFQTNLVNMQFASRVAALVRYAQLTGTRVEQVYDEVGNATIYSEIFHFRVTAPDGSEMGSYAQQIGSTCEMHLHSEFVDIDMDYHDEAGLNIQMFGAFKMKDKYGNALTKTPIRNVGFKFTLSSVGFNYTPLTDWSESEYDSAIASMGLYTTMEEVIEAHSPEKDYAWLMGMQYEIVSDENLDEVMKEYMDYDGIIGIDTETSGLNITFMSREGKGDQLVGICLSKEEGKGHYFPLQMKYIKNLCGGDHWYFMEKYMKKFCETHDFVTHNLSFDWKVFFIYGIDLHAVFDTMLAYGVTERYKNANFEYGLKALTHNIFGLDMLELSDFVRGGGKWGGELQFWDLSYELVKHYGPTDAERTLALCHHVKKKRLLETFRAEEVFNIELKYAKVIAYSEFYGYHIDIGRLPEFITNFEDGMEVTQSQLEEIAGESFNPASTKDLGRIMYDKLKIPDTSKKRSTAKDVLRELAEVENVDGTPTYPFVLKLKEYRDYATTYKNFIKKRDKFISPEGYIFPHVYTFGTETGRVSVKEPNYQSYNDIVKKYVTPRPGYKMWDCDFSQIEYRVLCSMAHEPKLIESFADPDMDYHTYQAARMFGVPYGAVTKPMRQQSKGINFGLPYGMGDSSLGARIFGARTPETKAKATKLREVYFEGQDNIRKFFDTVRDNGVADGFTRTLFGRLRYYHKGSFSENAIRRQAGNHVIQGCLGGDTLITTRKYGIMPIKDLVGRTLEVWDGEAWTWGDVTSSGLKQKCIVTFTNGTSIVCSPIHKFLVYKKGREAFVECKNLRFKTKQPDRVVMNKKYCAADYTNFVSKPSASYTQGQWLGRYIHSVILGRPGILPEGLSKYVSLHNIHENVWMDTEMLRGYLTGILEANAAVKRRVNRLIAKAEHSKESLLIDIQKALLHFGVRSTVAGSNGLYYLHLRSHDMWKLDNVVDVETPVDTALNAEKPDYLIVKSVVITDEQIDMYDVCNTERGYYLANGLITHNTAADLYKLACCRVFDMLVAKGWLGKVLLNAFIHDEILGEVSTEINYYEFVEEWRKAFEVPMEGFCKLYAGLGIGNSWYEAKKADWPPQLIDLIIKSENREHWDGDPERFLKWVKDTFYQYGIDRVREALIQNAQSKAEGTLDEHNKIIKPVIDGFLKEKVTDWLNSDVEHNVPAANEVIGKEIKLITKVSTKNLTSQLMWLLLAKKIDLHISQFNLDEAIANPDAPIKVLFMTNIKKAVTEWLNKDIVANKEEAEKLLGIQLGYDITINAKSIKDLQDWLKIFCFWQKDIDYASFELLSADAIQVSENVNANVSVEPVEVEEMSEDAFLAATTKNFGFMLDYATNRLILNMNMMGVTNMSEKFISLFNNAEGLYSVWGMTFNEDGTYTLVETPVKVSSSDILLMQTFLQGVNGQYLSLMQANAGVR